MARYENTNQATEDALNAAQVVYFANPFVLAPHATHVWKAQEQILDEVEKFSNAWFRRREDTARSLIDAGRRIVSSGGPDPARMMREVADWNARAMAGLADDARECTELLSRCAGAVVSNEVEALEETAETVERATKSSKARPV